MIGAMHLQNVYKAVGWEATPSFVTTDTPSNTFCRAPGLCRVDKIKFYGKIGIYILPFANKRLLSKRTSSTQEVSNQWQ